MFIKINNERYNINSIQNYHPIDDSKFYSIEFIIDDESIIVDYSSKEERENILEMLSQNEIILK